MAGDRTEFVTEEEAQPESTEETAIKQRSFFMATIPMLYDLDIPCNRIYRPSQSSVTT